MKAETQKVIDKLRVKLVVKGLPCMPNRGLSNDARAWRTTLTRKVGRGEDSREFKLATISILDGTAVTGEPGVNDVLEYLLADCLAGLLSYWDFEQTYGNRPKHEIEHSHAACKKLGTRAKRFFGDAWDKIVRSEQGNEMPNVSKVRGVKIRKSA